MLQSKARFYQGMFEPVRKRVLLLYSGFFYHNLQLQVFLLPRHGRNGEGKLLNSTAVHSGFNVITVKPGRD